MSDSAAFSALVDGRVSAGQKAMLYGCLFALASLATAIVIFAIGVLVSGQKEQDAGRMIVASQKDAGYIATVINGYGAAHGQPGRL